MTAGGSTGVVGVGSAGGGTGNPTGSSSMGAAGAGGTGTAPTPASDECPGEETVLHAGDSVSWTATLQEAKDDYSRSAETRQQRPMALTSCTSFC